MSERVKVINRGRRHLVLRWRDPATGGWREKSAGTAKRREAQQRAGEMAADLRQGRYVEPSKITWDDFRQRFEEERLPALAAGTGELYAAVFNGLERHARPQSLKDVTAQRISSFEAAMRKQGLAEATIARHLRHLKAALRWANSLGLLAVMPAIHMPRRAKGRRTMHGRAITGAEFDRFVAAVPMVVTEPAVSGWQRFLRGLWWSGLRCGEAVELYWDREDRLSVDFTGAFPMLCISAEWEKGHRDRRLPLAPEFAELLEHTPPDERHGRVFNLLRANGRTQLTDRREVSRLAGAIGKASGVITIGEGSGEDKTKYVSLHDLRRSFALRWAERGLPVFELKEMMRHRSIETTLTYYVGQDADRIAARVWERRGKRTGLAQGDTAGDNTPAAINPTG